MALILWRVALWEMGGGLVFAQDLFTEDLFAHRPSSDGGDLGVLAIFLAVTALAPITAAPGSPQLLLCNRAARLFSPENPLMVRDRETGSFRDLGARPSFRDRRMASSEEGASCGH